eukprot:1195035-Prorocentrum_minimum.AAC.4
MRTVCDLRWHSTTGGLSSPPDYSQTPCLSPTRTTYSTRQTVGPQSTDRQTVGLPERHGQQRRACTCDTCVRLVSNSAARYQLGGWIQGRGGWIQGGGGWIQGRGGWIQGGGRWVDSGTRDEEGGFRDEEGGFRDEVGGSSDEVIPDLESGERCA